MLPPADHPTALDLDASQLRRAIERVAVAAARDDSRPILLRRSDEHPSCLTVLGAKIDSVYDVEEALTTLIVDEPSVAVA